MKLASCDNCDYRKAGQCALGQTPDQGDFLCGKYEMTEAFRSEIISLARKEFERDINQAMLEISALRAEQEQAWAG